MTWSAPNYRLADAYINNTIDEREAGRNTNPFSQSFIFNGNGLRGNDIDFRRQMHEIMSQTDYGLKKNVPEETITDKIDLKDEYIQDRFNEQKREILAKQADHIDNGSYNNAYKNTSINPYIPTRPVVQPYIIKSVSSPLDSILTTTVLVIIGVLLCFLLIRALFSIKAPEKKQVVGNMNLDSMVDEIEQDDAEN